MLLLSLSILTMPVNQDDLLASQSYPLYLPKSYYTETSHQNEWFDDLYTLDLELKKETLLQFSEETKNIYASYMDDFYGPEYLPFYDILIGRPSHRIFFHSAGWAGDVSGFSSGFSYIERLDNNKVWGIGVERGEVTHSKNRPWNEGSYYHIDGFLEWQPSPDVSIYLGVDAVVPE